MSREFKIGLLTIVAGALLYYGFNYLRGSDLFSPTDKYYVTYKNVTGLTVSNPIYYSGLPVGRVSAFQLQQDEGNILVTLDIDRSVFVGDDASATLTNDGLLGGKAILLDVGTSQDRLVPGDTLKSEIADGLFEQFEPLRDNFNTTIVEINQLLDQLNATDIKGVVDTLKYSIGSLTYKARRMDLETPLQNLDELLVGFQENSRKLDEVLASSKTLMDSLNSIPMGTTVSLLNETLEETKKLMVSLQSDEGSLGQLMTNDTLYNNLNKLLVDLDVLTNHFNNYPKDFLKPLGRKHKKLRGVSQEGS